MGFNYPMDFLIHMGKGSRVQLFARHFLHDVFEDGSLLQCCYGSFAIQDLFDEMRIRFIRSPCTIQNAVYIGITVRHTGIKEPLLRRAQLDDRIYIDIVLEFSLYIIKQ
ncbi:hypothetical protein D3C77_445870 [compost metagenome]